MASEGFWDNQDRAKKTVAYIKSLKAQTDPLTGVMKDFEDAKVAYEMSREAGDKDFLAASVSVAF